jgi:hypothetical protein
MGLNAAATIPAAVSKAAAVPLGRQVFRCRRSRAVHATNQQELAVGSTPGIMEINAYSSLASMKAAYPVSCRLARLGRRADDARGEPWPEW